MSPAPVAPNPTSAIRFCSAAHRAKYLMGGAWIAPESDHLHILAQATADASCPMCLTLAVTQ